MLEEVRYGFDYAVGQTATDDEPKRIVLVRFRNVRPSNAEFSTNDGFFILDPESAVEID